MRLWDLFGKENGGDDGDVHGSREDDRKPGAQSDWLGYDERNADREDPTDYWSPPSFPRRGMTTKELAEFQKAFTRHARGRIYGVGAAQYAQTERQKFESYPVFRLIEEAQDEAADLINYATMIAIQLERIKEKYV